MEAGHVLNGIREEQPPALPASESLPRQGEATLQKLSVGQHQWYHFGIGAPPILIYFSGDWDVHRGYGMAN